MKEVRDYYDQFDTCREHDIPLCSDACPFKIDFLDIQERIANKRFNAAYKTIRDNVAFPLIVSKVCPAYCEAACVRSQIDETVQIKKLEQSCIALATRKDPNAYNLPPRNTKVAVIGGGISGMAFALKMASRKCNVTVFEKTSQIGGKLIDVMDETEFLTDFELQFKHEKYELRLNTEASVDAKTGEVTVSPTSVRDENILTDAQSCIPSEKLYFDVVYIATGKGGDNFGVTDYVIAGTNNTSHADNSSSENNPGNGHNVDDDNSADNTTNPIGIFSGGSLNGKDLMHALADGIKIAACADGFAKTGNIDYPVDSAPSKCVANEDKLIKTPAVVASGGAMTSGGTANSGEAIANGGKTNSGGSMASGGTLDNGGAMANGSTSDSCEATTSGNAAASDILFTEEECLREADRCIRCQCDACETYCDLIRFYEKWPVKMRDEIFLSVKPAGSLVHKCPSRKYIAACTDCKILDDACPENIDLCGMIKSARHQMHAVEKMPAAYRQYYLRDMDFANGEYAAVVKTVKGNSKYAFFPGCNLGALNPDYVIKPYKWLLDNYPGTGLLLKCCSVPIDWAGNGQAHKEALSQLKADWESLGKPTLVTACMSCDKHLHEYLPEIETISIYELMSCAGETTADETAACGVASDQLTVGQECKTNNDTIYTIFDPCSARGNEKVQEAVRKLAEGTGIFATELAKGDMHGCCGFGGQGAIAQPKFAQYIAEKRIAESEHPYLVYCSNCRDVFTAQGMPAIHIFDLLFDINGDNSIPSPGITQRRVNRVLLKEKLLKEFWGEDMIEKPEQLKYSLIMNEAVADKVEKLHILHEDIINVIEYAERTKRRTFNPDNKHYKAYNEIGAITLWVEYSQPGGADVSHPGGADRSQPGGADGSQPGGEDNRREIHNVYSHRMQIKLEAVFNGKKIDG